jgi:predicted PurR-regulated permease PerM
MERTEAMSRRVNEPESGFASTNSLERAAQRLEKTETRVHRRLRTLTALMVVLAAVVIGLATVVQRNSHNVDNLEDITEETQDDVQHIDDFVTELEQPPTPEEQAQDQAVATVLQLVPENLPQIRQILCEAFPDTTPCLSQLRE